MGETFAERLADEGRVPLAPEFVAWLKETARVNGITEDEAWAKWRGYSEKCDLYGQSALTNECADWNGWKRVEMGGCV